MIIAIIVGNVSNENRGFIEVIPSEIPGPAYSMICFENIGVGIVIQGPLLIGVIGKLDAGPIAVEEDVLVPKLVIAGKTIASIAIPAYKRADEILAIELLAKGQARSERGRRWSGGGRARKQQREGKERRKGSLFHINLLVQNKEMTKLPV